MIQKAENGNNGKPNGKHPGGRPSKLDDKTAIKIFLLARKGLTDKEIARVFDVRPQTINNWKKSPEFFDSLKSNKAEADAIVERSLFERACGYEHETEEIFCTNGVVTKVKTVKVYPPDPTSMIFWLKNRQPDKWRDLPKDSGKEIEPKLPIVRLYADARN